MKDANELINNTPELHAKGEASDLVTRMAAANELASNPEVVKEIKKYGKVPVVYMPTRAMLRPSPHPGLLHFINNATTVKEVENMLARGNEYKDASAGTIRRWQKAAKKRIAQLTPAKQRKVRTKKS